jgi:hypothetical protein
MCPFNKSSKTVTPRHRTHARKRSGYSEVSCLGDNTLRVEIIDVSMLVAFLFHDVSNRKTAKSDSRNVEIYNDEVRHSTIRPPGIRRRKVGCPKNYSGRPLMKRPL